jgi:hypothetical protein
MGGAQAAFAIGSILQVLLVALASTMCVHYFTTNKGEKFNVGSCSLSIFASWKESVRVIRLSGYATIAHLAVNVVVLASLLTAVTSVMPCPTGRLRCPKLVTAKAVWIALSAIILIIQPCECDDWIDWECYAMLTTSLI